MDEHFIKIHKWLYPASWLYGAVVMMRNKLFDWEVLQSKSFDIPIISVGNLAVGGTGKTPHTEYLIKFLCNQYKVAVLSRGYKRHTKGYVLATPESTARSIGDEPYQMHQKFPSVTVAVDEKRCHGIEKLLALQKPSIDVILLDDAFQHRYVQADKNIVLIDYNRPVHEDCLLPAGRLRESVQALKRADYIIVTKCPKSIQPIEKRILSKHLKIKPYQQLFFTTLEYGKIKPLFPQYESIVPDRSSSILCLTGIAQPGPYIDHLKTFTSDITEIRYPDHHHFSKKDFQQIARAFESIENPKKYIFTTEKDAVRLKACPLPEELQRVIYYIPVEPVFIDQDDLLLNEISEYVRKNQR